MVDKNEKEKTNVVVRYANGPILAIGNDASSDVQAAANFISDFARKKSSPIGVMVDSPAIVTSDPTDGSGRVILISPHVEDGEPCTKGHFRNLFRWASKKKYDRESTDDDRGKWWRELVKQGKVLFCSFNPKTAAIEHVLTFHFLIQSSFISSSSRSKKIPTKDE